MALFGSYFHPERFRANFNYAIRFSDNFSSSIFGCLSSPFRFFGSSGVGFWELSEKTLVCLNFEANSIQLDPIRPMEIVD